MKEFNKHYVKGWRDFILYLNDEVRKGFEEKKLNSGSDWVTVGALNDIIKSWIEKNKKELR